MVQEVVLIKKGHPQMRTVGLSLHLQKIFVICCSKVPISQISAFHNEQVSKKAVYTYKGTRANVRRLLWLPKDLNSKKSHSLSRGSPVLCNALDFSGSPSPGDEQQSIWKQRHVGSMWPEILSLTVEDVHSLPLHHEHLCSGHCACWGILELPPCETWEIL